MSRLDRHIAVVQSKLAAQQFLDALMPMATAWLLLVAAAVLLQRLLQFAPPRPGSLVIGAGMVAALAAGVLAWRRKPTAMSAAVAIDGRLGLKEKFSTALQFRGSGDPFAAAAVNDAEQAARSVQLQKQFQLRVPRRWPWVVGAAVVVGGMFLLPSVDLFGHAAHKQQLARQEAVKANARRTVAEALATVGSYPKSLQTNEAVALAKRDLENLLNHPINDPAAAQRTAYKALDQANEAVKSEIKQSSQFAQAQENQKAMAAIQPGSNEQGPVADAQRSLAQGNFAAAMSKLQQTASKFNQLSAADQAKAAQQMSTLAKQLQQMASNPAAAQQVQKQLQQMTGMSQQQAKQLQQTMQQAMAGDPKAQQQLQQMQQQAQQQMNNGRGPTPQQQTAMQSLMKQMQAQASSQQSAQQMSQAAQQMAQAMQQQAANQQAANQQGQQGSPQQSSQQQQASSQQQNGQSQQSQSKQGQSAQGQQQSPGQSMQQAQEQMQQAMGQMDAVQKDAQEMQAAQQATSAAQDQASSTPGGTSPPSPLGSNAPPRTGQWAQGDPAGHIGNGMGGPGHGNGGQATEQQTPYTVKREIDPTRSNDTGRILASSFVKAGTVKGDSRLGLEQAAAAAERDQADEVDEESVSKDSQKVVKQYFQTMQDSQ